MPRIEPSYEGQGSSVDSVAGLDLAALAECLPVGIVVLEDSTLVWINAKALELLGLSSPQVCGSEAIDPGFRCVALSSSPRVRECEVAVVAGGASWLRRLCDARTVRVERCDRTTVCLQVAAQERSARTVLTLSDVTELWNPEPEDWRRRSDLAAAKGEPLLSGFAQEECPTGSALANSMTLATLTKLALVACRTGNLVVVTDAELRTEWVNQAFTRVTEYTLEEVRGQVLGPFVQGPETDPLTQDAMRSAVRNGNGFLVEVLNYSKSGRKYWIEIDCRPYHAADGSVLGFIAVETEVTARKALEAELRKSESRLRAFLEGQPDLVFRISADGCFLDVHAPSEDALLAPSDAFLGQHVTAVLSAEVSLPLLHAIEQVLKYNVPNTFEYRLDMGGRTRHFEARVVSGMGRDVLAIVRDVSERKLLDVMKDEFISTVSHEVRTPLTAIHGALGLLSAGVLGPLGPTALNVVNAALGNSERLGRLVNDILDLDSAVRCGVSLTLTPVDLVPLIKRAVAESAVYAAEYQVSYVVDVLERDLRVSVDSDRFMQVIQNLLSNAAKYGNSEDAVHVGCLREGASMRVYVRNRGAPIPGSFRDRIFTRFAVLDGTNMRSRQGTGLGLAIAKTLIERMHGTIDYMSTAEMTEFFVTVPVWTEPEYAS